MPRPRCRAWRPGPGGLPVILRLAPDSVRIAPEDRLESRPGESPRRGTGADESGVGAGSRAGGRFGGRFGRRGALALLGGVAGAGLFPGPARAAAALAAPFSDAALEDLGQRLHALRRRFGLRRAIGIRVVDLGTGAALFDHNADRLFVPASGMKLPVMAGCLHYLGPNYRFPTRLLLDAPPEQGVIRGPLRVAGSGDPSLTRHDLDFVADSLAAAGIREVRGDFVLDDSFFTPQETNPQLVRRRMARRLPIQSALGYMWNRVEVAGVPGPGQRPAIRDEGYGYYEIRNRMVLRDRGRPYIVARRQRGRSVRLEGRVLREGNERVARFTAPEPALYFGHALRGKLRERGVVAPGAVLRGRPGEGEGRVLLYRHESAPLTQVLEALGKYSNNWAAEQLLFALGAHRWGPPGTLGKGRRALEEYLVGLGFPASGFSVADGSGLSRENRLSARMLTEVVLDFYRRPEVRDDFLCSLAVSGVDGTLARRMRGEDTLGRIIAKTGSLAAVSSLSGVAFPAGRGRALGFSVLTNGIRNQWSGDAVENRIAGELLRWGEAAA